MANLSEDIQCAGSDTRPPMLDRTDFASWQQRIRLYCRGKENGVNILKSIDEGPFQMGTFRETLSEGNEGALHLGPERPRVYSDLSPEDKDRTYGYNVKRCWKLNSKFFNTMLPEWGRFVTAVKLNRGLRESNYDQLYAYLKQHEAHVNENKMMLDRFTQHTVNPLVLMSNVATSQYKSQSSHNPHPHMFTTLADNSQLDSGLSPTDNLIENLTNTLALLTQSYKTYLPQTNNQLRTLSNPRNQATILDGKVVVQNVQGRQNRGQDNNARGAGHTARICTQPKRPQNSEYFKDKMLLKQAQENGVALDEEQLLFLAGGHDNALMKMWMSNLFWLLLQMWIMCFKLMTVMLLIMMLMRLTAQTMFMANLSSADPIYDEAGPSYDSNILSEYVKDNAVPVVQSNVSSVTNDAYMMIYNEMCEPHAQKHDEIERKNLLIANDNLIVDCLFKDVFHVATNSELNVSSFTKMHDAHTSLKARCLELEVELSDLRDKIQKDNHDE
ncbi:hypothetical protein Tco_0893362 [Tanacetum coccineum]|uniref:Integrase, catalytic region, zinc finger, CCHC-type, peptidase aspartic, catalytic n=1 Tax=Tanacetum coccineum TaxID=301880 RepID=A0ABQ5C8M6_9ASTR